ncbi:MAG: alpha/beta fold hydrolase [Lachnospira sp.]|nr:alpha/beta fold hydrolase [Lachnospira sp.]
MAKRVYKIPSTNGKDMLHTVVWRPKEQKVKGVVQISHGMIEYVERYERLANFLNDAGFVVVGNDHLGHGYTAKDEEALGYFDAQDGSRTVVRDLYRVTKFIKKRYPDVPFFLLGHSMGSFMARRYAMMYGDELDGLLLLGTGYQKKPVLLLGYAVLASLHKLKGDHCRSNLMEFMAFGTYNILFLKDKSAQAWVTRDPDILKQYENDPFCTFKFTVNGYKTLFDTLWYIEKQKNMKHLPKHVPMFFGAGTKDPVGHYGKDIDRIVDEYRELGIEDVEQHMYKWARHEILNELEYFKVHEDILDWLERHV